MERHIKTKESMLQCQVCSAGTYEEALLWLRRNHPAGTDHNWHRDERECVAPVKCADHPERTHYVFVC